MQTNTEPPLTVEKDSTTLASAVPGNFYNLFRVMGRGFPKVHQPGPLIYLSSKGYNENCTRGCVIYSFIVNDWGVYPDTELIFTKIPQVSPETKAILASQFSNEPQLYASIEDVPIPF